MFGQFGYRIPHPAATGAVIALESLGGGSATGKAAGDFYQNTIVTVGTMDKWIICSTITRSVDSGIARISAFDYISSAATHNMALLNEVSIVPAIGNAACVQHWGVRVNDGINFGTFRRYVDAGGSNAHSHYYNRMRIQGAALNLVAFNEGQNVVDKANAMGSGSFNSNGLQEQVVFTFWRDDFSPGTTQTGQSHNHFNPTLGAVAYIGETSQRGAVSSHTMDTSWTGDPQYGCCLTTRIKSI